MKKNIKKIVILSIIILFTILVENVNGEYDVEIKAGETTDYTITVYENVNYDIEYDGKSTSDIVEASYGKNFSNLTIYFKAKSEGRTQVKLKPKASGFTEIVVNVTVKKENLQDKPETEQEPEKDNPVKSPITLKIGEKVEYREDLSANSNILFEYDLDVVSVNSLPWKETDGTTKFYITGLKNGTTTVTLKEEVGGRIIFQIKVTVDDSETGSSPNYSEFPSQYEGMYENKVYLTMDLNTLIATGTDIRNLLKENQYLPEDETKLRQLLTKINDMINSIRNNPGTPDEWLGQAQNYINSAEPTVSEEQIIESAVRIGRILITAAAIIFPIIFLILGIKYFMAGPDEKGRLKTQLIGIITAAVITFGAYTIWKIAYAIINSVLQ